MLPITLHRLCSLWTGNIHIEQLTQIPFYCQMSYMLWESISSYFKWITNNQVRGSPIMRQNIPYYETEYQKSRLKDFNFQLLRFQHTHQALNYLSKCLAWVFCLISISVTLEDIFQRRNVTSRPIGNRQVLWKRFKESNIAKRHFHAECIKLVSEKLSKCFLHYDKA